MRPEWNLVGQKADGSGLNIFSCFNCERRCMVEVSTSKHNGSCIPDPVEREFSRFQRKEYAVF